MDANSFYGKRAIEVGLDPETSSIFAVCCAENGLDPKTSSLLDLASKKTGKSLSLNEAQNIFGKEWVMKVTA